MSVSEEMVKEEEAKQQTKIFCPWIKSKQLECRFPNQIRMASSYNERHLICLCCFTPEILDETIREAGMFIGIGDSHNDGYHGRFKLLSE
jgi:hypothetical protein